LGKRPDASGEQFGAPAHAGNFIGGVSIFEKEMEYYKKQQVSKGI
jgi:hypothetical protein